MTRNQTMIGFLATLLLFVSLVMLVLREPVLQTRAAEAQLVAAIDDGMEIYLENCVVCHGASGEGLGVYPSLEAAAAMDQETLFKTIDRGRYGTQMAAYGIDEGGVLSRDQIDALVALIQHGDWGVVYAQAEALDVVPPQMVVAEIPTETLTDVRALPNGDLLATGLTLYAENCTSCHGVHMEGTTLAPTLNTAEVRGTEGFELSRLIKEGVPGTLMAGWDNALGDGEVDALVTLIQRWPEVESAGIAIPVVEAQPIEMSAEAIAQGERLFGIVCASCHGATGYGTQMAPALNNDLFLSSTSDAQIHQIISMGVPGTVMPAWGGRLSDSQINDLIAYLRSLAPDAPTITQPR